jgi:thiol-disulfide isomerase/thioredoxin
MTTQRTQTGLSRRTALILTGVTAAAAGLGWRLSRHDGTSTAPAPASTAATGSSPVAPALTSGDAVPANFWTQSFERPQGGELKLATLQGKPMLINFWATWCPPCVKEMPELDHFHREFAPLGWTVLGLAVDGPTPVREFLAKVRVGFDIGLAGFGGTELAQALGNDAGGLPFSVIVDAQGRIAHRKMGATSFDELATWARALRA